MLFSAKVIVICGVLILSVTAGLFILMSSEEPRLKYKQIPAPEKLSIEFPKPSSFSDKPSTFKKSTFESLNIPALPIPKPDFEAIAENKSLPNAVTPFFENINKAAKAVEESIASEITNTMPAQNTSIRTSDGIILSLNKVQFHFLYPDYFIASLIDAQNLFIKEHDPAYEPLLKIETDAQVRTIEEKIVTTLLAADMITKEKAERFITTIRFTLPELQLIDLKMYNSYGFYKSSPRTTPKGLFLAGLMEQFKNALANKAQAAICGTCSSLPLCFQEGAATPGMAGSELFYPSCYCTGCLTSLGCLSANSGKAAIYDQATGICGVGL